MHLHEFEKGFKPPPLSRVILSNAANAKGNFPAWDHGVDGSFPFKTWVHYGAIVVSPQPDKYGAVHRRISIGT